MFCKYCGHQIADDSKFCEFCGKLVQHIETVTPPEREPDIPAPIGAPIFKEVVFDEPAEPETQPMPEQIDEVNEPEPVEEEPQAEPTPAKPKKKVNKGLVIGLIAGGVVLIAGIVAAVLLLSKPKIAEVDAAKFVDFKVSGYNGYGTATCTMDWDGLELAALGEFPKGSDSKSRTKQVEYKEKAVILHGAVELEFIDRKNVSVGDKLTATVKVQVAVEKELNIKFIGSNSAEYTVKEKDLNGSTEIDIIGSYLKPVFTGNSGAGVPALEVQKTDKPFEFTMADGTDYTVTAESADGDNAFKLVLTDKKEKSYEKINIACKFSPDKELKNGDKVTLSLEDGVTDKLMKFGLHVKENKKEFEVSGLTSPVTALDQIDKTTVNGWISKYSAALTEYVKAHWDDAIHDGNKIPTQVTEISNVMAVKQVLAQPESDGKSAGNRLYLVFTADVLDDAIALNNHDLPISYTFAVKIDNLQLDEKGKLMTDKIVLPDKNKNGFLGAYSSYDELETKIKSQNAEIIE